MTLPRYLLDTNIFLICALSQGVVAQRIMEVVEAAVRTSIIVAAELRFGIAKKNSLRLIK